MALIDACQGGVSLSREAIKFAIGEEVFGEKEAAAIHSDRRPEPFDSLEIGERFLAKVQACPISSRSKWKSAAPSG